MKVLYIHTGKVLLYNATFGNTTVTQGNTALLAVTLMQALYAVAI